MAAKQEVKTTGDNQVPAFMQQYAGMGAENISASDVSVPLLKLMQGLSPEVEEGKATIGEFFHLLADMPLGKSLDITPIIIRKRVVLWRPRWDGGGILARSQDCVNWDTFGEWEVRPNKDAKSKVTWRNVDGARHLTVAESRLTEWGSSDPSDPDSQPAASLTYDIGLYLHDHPDLGPVVISLSRTGVRPAQDFQGKVKLAAARFPIFGMKFMLSSWVQTAGDNKFQNVKFSSHGLVTDEQTFETCKGFYEHFKEMNVVVQDVHPDENVRYEEGTKTAF